MSTRAPGGDVPVRRIDRILAFMSLGLIIVSIGCLFAIIIARPAGVTDFTVGLWPLVAVFPLVALPIGLILIIVLLVMSFVRRSRANRGGSR